MTWTPAISAERRAAIARASRAIVRLSSRHDVGDLVHRQHAIVSETATYNDEDAWQAVATLERLLTRSRR